MSSVVVTLTERQVRLVLALLEHAANEHAEAMQDQNWDWLGDLFNASWEDLEGTKKAFGQ